MYRGVSVGMCMYVYVYLQPQLNTPEPANQGLQAYWKLPGRCFDSSQSYTLRTGLETPG